MSEYLDNDTQLEVIEAWKAEGSTLANDSGQVVTEKTRVLRLLNTCLHDIICAEYQTEVVNTFEDKGTRDVYEKISKLLNFPAGVNLCTDEAIVAIAERIQLELPDIPLAGSEDLGERSNVIGSYDYRKQENLPEAEQLWIRILATLGALPSVVEAVGIKKLTKSEE